MTPTDLTALLCICAFCGEVFEPFATMFCNRCERKVCPKCPATECQNCPRTLCAECKNKRLCRPCEETPWWM